MIRPNRRRCVMLLVAALGVALPTHSAAQSPQTPTVCDGRRISRIVIRNEDVFSPSQDDPRWMQWAYGTANLLHVRTTRGFIGKELLFREGECLDPFLLTESARLLDGYSFLRSVDISSEEEDGGVVVYVDTRDEWTTQVDLGVTYDEGLNLERLQVTELNLLGNGIRAEGTRRRRREDRSESLSLSSPRLFGRADIGAHASNSPGGSSWGFGVNHGFVGDVGSVSAGQSIGSSTSFFSYAAPEGSEYSHILVPVRNESFELAYGRRFGGPGEAWIVGLDLARRAMRLQGTPEYVVGSDFDGPVPSTEDFPPAVGRQLQSRGATRLSLHLGTRRYRFVQMEGLDAIRDVQWVGDGIFASVGFGRSLGVFVADSIEAGDTYGRMHFSFGKMLGGSYLTGGVSGEAGRTEGRWRDLLAGADLVAYGRAGWLPNQTLFLRMSSAGGWRTTVPFQLTLGGRDGVRSLLEDRYPGGRRLLVTVEDRIRLDWPDWQAADMGLTVFGDVGKIWAGDAPLGVDSSWQASVGFGLRLAFPRGSRNIWRPDVVFPLGREGSPVFRVTFELNRVRSGFYTHKIARSMRFKRGAESY